MRTFANNILEMLRKRKISLSRARARALHRVLRFILPIKLIDAYIDIRLCFVSWRYAIDMETEEKCERDFQRSRHLGALQPSRVARSFYTRLR